MNKLTVSDPHLSLALSDISVNLQYHCDRFSISQYLLQSHFAINLHFPRTAYLHVSITESQNFLNGQRQAAEEGGILE